MARDRAPLLLGIATAAVVLCVTCRQAPRLSRAEELAACQLISMSGSKLGECLVLTYSWRADSARVAMTRWQVHIDSIRADDQRRVAAIIAQRQQDSARARRRWIDSMSRRAAPWSDCVMQQWRTEGGNWSVLPCKKFRYPTFEEVVAYQVAHRLPEDEGALLTRAHELAPSMGFR